MRKRVTLNNQPVAYTLKRSWRAKRLRLVVHPGGELTVSAPFFLSAGAIERFIQQKAQWVLQTIKRLGRLRPHSRHVSQKQYSEYHEKALDLVLQKIILLSKTYGVRVRDVNIRDQKTRWGSCSKKGNLNFNYRIIFLDSWLQDYIITHELCHLQEFNHSPKFWHLVAKTVPNYKAARKQLRKNPIQSYQ